jgi:hypothetical protein
MTPELETTTAQPSQDQPTRRNVLVYNSNPFMPELGIKSKTRRVTNKTGDMMLVSSETGEIKSQIAGFWTGEEVDSTKFVKLFVNGVKALAELSNPGTRVFEILYLEMQGNIGKDTVYLSYIAIGIHQKSISRSTFARGIAELIQKKFIAAQPAPGWYWVNPDYMWNGDRLTFLREYRKKSTANTYDPRQQSLPLELTDPDSHN